MKTVFNTTLHNIQFIIYLTIVIHLGHFFINWIIFGYICIFLSLKNVYKIILLKIINKIILFSIDIDIIGIINKVILF